MRELRERLRGYDKDEHLGRWFLRIGGLGNVYVNRNVVRRFGGIEGVLKAPDNWLVSVRLNGEAWLYRIASPLYVEVPAEDVVRIVKEVLPNVANFGHWDGERVWVEEGAVYGSITGIWGRGSHPRVGDFVYITRITWGNDGFTAFKIKRVLGILQCENGLVVGEEFISRVFHSRLNKPLSEKINEVLGRIRRIITGSKFNNYDVERLMKPVDAKVIEDLSKRFSDFPRLYGEYRAQYGDTLLAVLQALGWIATHGSQRNSERAISAMGRLVSLN
jgi:hypothetical protein